MKFIPLRLFKCLYPVDIQKQVNTHFEETLKNLTAENSDYQKQIIQLGNLIIQISEELQETKQLLEEMEINANRLEANVLHLNEVLDYKEHKRELLFEKLELHRDAFRVVVATLTKLGARDPVNDGL